MFIIFLKFGENRAKVRDYLDAHKAWLKQGYEAGIFLMSGSLQENSGGALLAHNTSLAELQRRMGEDPFVAQEIAIVEIIEVTPSAADERLSFLLPQ